MGIVALLGIEIIRKWNIYKLDNKLILIFIKKYFFFILCNI